MTTCLEKLRKAERWRIKIGGMGSDETYGWNGAFAVPIEGEMWHVIIADGAGWRHLSIKCASRHVMPTWTVMCRAKELFFGDEDWACEFHPAKDDYVNDHPFVLHIWQPLDEPLPRPPIFMV